MTETLAPETAGRVRAAFARHETFHPRYGWLQKAYLAAAEDPGAFHAADATTVLGVGKNMVRAIRYWGLAFKIIEETPNPSNPRLSDVQPTAFGDQLLSTATGWDTYLENPGSLWVLHWLLLRNVPECRAPAWWAILNSQRDVSLTDDALLDELRRYCDEHPEFGDIADNSLVKDGRCFLRMYASARSGRDLPEDSIDSPFAELDFLRELPGEHREYAINRGPKPNLPDAIVAWACLDYLRGAEVESRLHTLTGLTRTPGTPGRTFALSESALGDALARFVEAHPGAIELTDAAGLRQLVVPNDIGTAADAILATYYDDTKGPIR